MDQNGHQPWPVFTIAMPDMMLVGESLAPMKQGKLLLTEALYDQRFRTEDPAFNHVITGQPLLLKGHWTSIASRWSLGYFHWLMDDLPRLAPILEFPADTGIIIKGKLSSYMREALRILGYESRVRETTEKFLSVENFHFSSPVGMSGCTNPYAVEWLRKTFLPKAQYSLAPELPKKILILRKGKTRGILNMHILKDALEKRGWIAIDLETVPFAGQIALFANADCIVAEHGAALTNLVWCRPGSKVLELCPANFLNGCFEGISLCVGIDHYFEIFSADHLSRFTVPLSKLLERVQGW
jgi:capsular polysaccharide biosynthesis protein